MKDKTLKNDNIFKLIACKMYMSEAMTLLSLISIYVYSPRISGTPDRLGYCSLHDKKKKGPSNYSFFLSI